jgi:hypothetical protein
MDELAIPLEKPITHQRPRWQVGQGPNPLGGTPTVLYLGEWVYVDSDGNDVGKPWRDSSLDQAVTFDPENPNHLQAFGALDAVVKDEYQKKLAKIQAADKGEKA